MKLLFIADHHIKLGQRNVPREWAKDRYQKLWTKVNSIAEAEQVHYIVHGGDIFDDVPSMEEMGEYALMLETLSWGTSLIYPGNHEATKKHSSFFEHLVGLSRQYGAKIISGWMNEDSVKEQFGISNVSILPYTDLHTKKWHKAEGKILLTHVRGAIEPHVKPEVDLDLFQGFDTVFAGDLHAHSNSQMNIVYPGSPVQTTFHRNRTKNENGIILIDTETCEWEFVDLEMPQLIRKTVESKEEIVATSPDHTIYELVGESGDLLAVEDVDLLDKKISRTVMDATLDFSGITTIEGELDLYLREREDVKDTSEYVTLFKDVTL